jgi:hypothetical protein
VVADVDWDCDHTADDEAEAAELVASVTREFLPHVQGIEAFNVTENDEARREELLKSVLIRGWAQRN